MVFIKKVFVIVNPKKYVGRVPGRVIARSENERFVDVLTGNGILRILEIDCEGEDNPTNIIKSVRQTPDFGFKKVHLLERIKSLEIEMKMIRSKLN